MNVSFWSSKHGFVALLFIAAVSYFLLIEHRQHFFEWLPYLIILACPAMHLFMHHGHGSHSHRNDGSNSNNNAHGSGNRAGSNDERMH